MKKIITKSDNYQELIDDIRYGTKRDCNHNILTKEVKQTDQELFDKITGIVTHPEVKAIGKTALKFTLLRLLGL